MVMKQTQTKMFDFADIGLDFSAGSKSLFPDRFKKMLAQGYNTQTVSSVTVEGNQVTLNYGGSHGYAADRVLKLNSPALVNINKGEFVIDSVTAQSVTLTIDNAPAAISGNFTTYVASLGYELVYEQANIHVYKFKALDESDLFLRLCFQNNSTYRNRISVCVGHYCDTDAGVISDSDAHVETKSCTSPATFAWEFTQSASSTFNNYTYTQGFAEFGKALLVGSKYHLACLCNIALSDNSMRINAILPVFSHYSNFPMIIGENRTITGNISIEAIDAAAAYMGNIRVSLYAHSNVFLQPYSETFLANYYKVDTFNTTSASPVYVYEYGTGQLFGIVQSGFYRIHYLYNAAPYVMTNRIAPVKSIDIDFKTVMLIHGLANSSNQVSFFAVGVEEVKIVS